MTHDVFVLRVNVVCLADFGMRCEARYCSWRICAQPVSSEAVGRSMKVGNWTITKGKSRPFRLRLTEGKNCCRHDEANAVR